MQAQRRRWADLPWRPPITRRWKTLLPLTSRWVGWGWVDRGAGVASQLAALNCSATNGIGRACYAAGHTAVPVPAEGQQTQQHCDAPLPCRPAPPILPAANLHCALFLSHHMQSALRFPLNPLQSALLLYATLWTGQLCHQLHVRLHRYVLPVAACADVDGGGEGSGGSAGSTVADCLVLWEGLWVCAPLPSLTTHATPLSREHVQPARNQPGPHFRRLLRGWGRGKGFGDTTWLGLGGCVGGRVGNLCSRLRRSCGGVWGVG